MYHTHYWGSLVGLHFRLLHHTEMIFFREGCDRDFLPARFQLWLHEAQACERALHRTHYYCSLACLHL